MTDADSDLAFDEELQELINSVRAPSEEVLPDVVDTGVGDDIAVVLAERTADLQRVHAEYINYKRRVDRDRDLARQRGIETVLSDLLPVLDGLDAARGLGELTQGETMMADELAKVCVKYGLSAYGEAGDPFDPHVHDALMKIPQAGFSVTSVVQVFQRGYLLGDRVLRPARVGVADAEPIGESGTDESGTDENDAVEDGV